MVVEVLAEAMGSRWWRWVVENRWESRQKSHTAQGSQRRANRGGRLECDFEGFASSFKIKHELGFIVDIASFQLASKSSKWVMFWLPNLPPKKVTRILSLKTI